MLGKHVSSTKVPQNWYKYSINALGGGHTDTFVTEFDNTRLPHTIINI